MKKLTTLFATLALLIGTDASAQTFKLGNGGYFNAGGVDVMAFNDYYPEGHQGGICVIMNGNRIATNGDRGGSSHYMYLVLAARKLLGK